jgi:hypothetical protein
MWKFGFNHLRRLIGAADLSMNAAAGARPGA